MVGQDYKSEMIPITLQPQANASSPSLFCGSLPIIDDYVVEDEECLGVMLVSGEGMRSALAFVSPVNATVCIEDNDRGVCVCVHACVRVCVRVCVCVCACIHTYVYVCGVCVSSKNCTGVNSSFLQRYSSCLRWTRLT